MGERPRKEKAQYREKSMSEKRIAVSGGLSIKSTEGKRQMRGKTASKG